MPLVLTRVVARVLPAALACTSGPEAEPLSVALSLPTTLRLQSVVTVSTVTGGDIGIAGVQFLVDDASVGPEDTEPPYAAAWDTRAHPNGAHVLSAVARDLDGKTAGAPPVAVTVSNPLPLADRIVFIGEGPSGSNDVFVMNGDGTGLVQLTNTDLYENDPAVSPDGLKIAFTRRLANRNLEIFVMNADGTGEVNLTQHPASDFHPSWSPDGAQIAFTSERALGREIFVMDSDGARAFQVTALVDVAERPAWSPDGTRIAFTRRTPQGQMAIVVVDATGARDLTPVGASERPAWSPDGSRLAFTRLTPTGGRIFLMNADGSNVHGISGGSDDSNPVWSRDGTRLVFERRLEDGNDRDIWVMNLDGGGAARLTELPGPDISPDVIP